jgi:DNA invertase Pin-like site-specific DNA recombinase
MIAVKIAVINKNRYKRGTTFLAKPPSALSNINHLQPNARRNCRRWVWIFALISDRLKLAPGCIGGRSFLLDISVAGRSTARHFSPPVRRGAVCLLEFEDAFPVVLHADQRPTIYLCCIESFVELAKVGLSIIGVLTGGIRVMHDQAKCAAAGLGRPLQHLQIAIRIPERRNGAAPNVLIDTDRLAGTVIKDSDMNGPYTIRDSGQFGRPMRVALYMRVSTGRQAEHDLSIPDQRSQLRSWCRTNGHEVVAEFVEAGASAGDDRRPAFQQMIERACDGEHTFDLIVVHSYSRFFREAFDQEFYLRKLAKYSVRVISITQPVGDEAEPVHAMMRKVIALFDEYQSKENAKHVIRSMKENARQGFWNGATCPLGYKLVEAERRGAKIKKRLAIDPVEVDTVRLIYKLYLNGDGQSGALVSVSKLLESYESVVIQGRRSDSRGGRRVDE